MALKGASDPCKHVGGIIEYSRWPQLDGSSGP